MAARAIGCYLATTDEVDTLLIIERAWRAQKNVYVPVIGGDGVMSFAEIESDTILERNAFGIWEPLNDKTIEVQHLDIVITPVVAFDRQQNRIGMGGGYYDRCFRFLKDRRKWLKPKLIGVAFECQRADSITPNRWDVPLYRVITNARQS